MGSYNSRFLHQVPAPLNQEQCFICNSKMTPHDKTPSQDSFQYECNECKSNVTIGVTGSLLLSKLYSKLLNNKAALAEIKRQLKQTTKSDFLISEKEVYKQVG